MLLTHQILFEPLVRQALKLAPDAVLHDSYAYWGKRLAAALSLPAAALIPNYLIPRQAFQANPAEFANVVFDMGTDQAKKLPKQIDMIEKLLKKKHSLHQVNLFDFMLNREALNVVFSIREIQMYASALDQSFYYVGASLVPSGWRDQMFTKFLSEGRPIVYVAMGTVINNDTDFYQMCLEVAKQLKAYYFVLSVGKEVPVEAMDKPENVYMDNGLPQCDILSHASVFITHAGHNSVNEALYHGVPMILHPLGNEQYVISQAMERLKLGVYHRGETVTKESLIRDITEVMENPSYRENLASYKKRYRNAGGADLAASRITDHFIMKIRDRDRNNEKRDDFNGMEKYI